MKKTGILLIPLWMLIPFNLNSQIMQGATGNLNIQSEPKGAEVYLDGIIMGNTPLSLKDIDAGEHIIRLTKPGYLDAETSITINPRENRNVKIILEETAETREKRLKYQSALDRYEARMEEYRQIAKPKKIWGFSLLGAGVVTGIAASVFYIYGLSNASSSYEDYKNSVQFNDISSSYNSVKDGESLVTIGHIMTGVTAVLVGASLYEFFTIPAKPVEPKPFTFNTMPIIEKNRLLLNFSTSF